MFFGFTAFNAILHTRGSIKNTSERYAKTNSMGINIAMFIGSIFNIPPFSILRQYITKLGTVISIVINANINFGSMSNSVGETKN